MSRNFVILEILKSRMNRGKRPELFFFRDTHGNEVDLIIRNRRQLIPIEIKSAATFSNSFLKGINMFRQLNQNTGPDGYVLYDGDNAFEVNGTRIQNIFVYGLPELLQG